MKKKMLRANLKVDGWSVWKLRNEIFFQRIAWTGIEKLLLRIVRMLLRRWMPMLQQEFGRQLEVMAT
jgi:hypothetical protein